FTKVHAQGALLAADASDRFRKEGVVPSALAGLPVSIKDLFDIAGEVTTAGSKILRDAPPASADAVAVARLRAAGAVVIGRSNMTEFAFSAIGINPHYGTPANPYDRGKRRIPGGSSSGAAVSVADGMAAFALGTDTGGSVRIPAALCGIAGVKPTRSRVPPAGPEFDEAAKANSGGGISPPEAYAVHRRWIDREQEIDPRVLERILRGGSLLAADYIDLLATRNRLAGRFARANYDIDVLVMPTVPRIAPPIE